MKAELETLRKRVKDYDDLFTSRDPAYASQLLKRGIGLLESDSHLLWKLLQENLGRSWFHKPMLDRTLNYKYHIDYEALDSIVADLNRLMLASNPKDVSKLITSNDGVLLGYMAEAFDKQKTFLMRELMKKEDSWENRLLADIADACRRDSLAVNDDDASLKDRGPSHTSGMANETESVVGGASGREKALKGTVRMLVNELKNTKDEKNKMYGNYEVLKANFSILEKYLVELTEAAGVTKEGVSMIQMVGRIKKLDPKILIKNNFSKVLSQGKSELIIRMATMATMNINIGVTKATNTKNSYFDDLGSNNTEAHELVTQSRKPRSRIPRDNDSYASSTSKHSKQKRIIQSFKGTKQDQVSNFNLKKSLASLSEEENVMVGREHTAKGKTEKYTGLASNSRNSPQKENRATSPNNQKHQSSSMNQITQSFDLTKKVDNTSAGRSEIIEKDQSPSNHDSDNIKPIQRKNSSDVSSSSLRRVKIQQVNSQERFASIPEYMKRVGKDKIIGNSGEKIKHWGQPDPRQYSVDKRKISILRSITIRPQIQTVKKPPQVSRSNSKHKDESKSFRSRRVTEDNIAMDSSVTHKSKHDLNKAEDGAVVRDGKTAWHRRNLHATDASLSYVNTSQRYKAGQRDQTRKLANVVKRTHHSTEYTRVSMEDSVNAKTMAKRDAASRSIAKNTVLESEENTILQSGRDVTATAGSLNKWVTGKSFNVPSQSKSRNRTYHGGLTKPHIDMEDPISHVPKQFVDIHQKRGSPPINATENMIDRNFQMFERRHRDAYHRSESRKPVDDEHSDSKLNMRFRRDQNVKHNDWQEPIINPTGVLCKISLLQMS